MSKKIAKVRGTAPQSKLTCLLHEKGLTRAQYARKIGVTKSRVTLWARDGVPESHVAEAARILDVPVARIPVNKQRASKPETTAQAVDSTLSVMDRLSRCEEFYLAGKMLLDDQQAALRSKYERDREALVVELHAEIERMQEVAARFAPNFVVATCPECGEKMGREPSESSCQQPGCMGALCDVCCDALRATKDSGGANATGR